MATMLYQGHGSYRLTTNDGTVIYVDPAFGEGYDAPADLIIITHEHPDHTFKLDSVARTGGCTELHSRDFLVGGEHKTLESHGVKMTSVLASNKYHDPLECMGVVLEFDGVLFYAAGDTSMTEDMRSGKLAALGLDYATFPADGFYNMDIPEATKCAKLVAAKRSIPMHLVPIHDVNEAVLFDEEKASAFEGPGKLVLHPGEEYKL